MGTEFSQGIGAPSLFQFHAFVSQNLVIKTDYWVAI
jgi:hypothetical protein